MDIQYMAKLCMATREYRDMLIRDPYRPTFHFAVPDSKGYPGDPNGAFFADGVYHLMYLYRNFKTASFHWGHIISRDLLHWTHLPDALTVQDGDEGAFSGGAFLDDDGTAYLTFWKFGAGTTNGISGGVVIAYAKAPYIEWTRMDNIAVEGVEKPWGYTKREFDGKEQYVGCADPSNIWKKDGYYYFQTGNIIVLDHFGRGENADPHYMGDWTDLFRSRDMKNWEYVGRFYDRLTEGEDLPTPDEDDMCPSFLPLFDAKENGKPTGKYLQLFISHTRGTQYYVGHMEGERFVPEKHGRMSWQDKAYFAPEALIDDRNRHIVWGWCRDKVNEGDFENFGWGGVFGFPRLVWLENDELRMAPADELDALTYHHSCPSVSADGNVKIANGAIFRLKATFDMTKSKTAGFRIRADADGKNYTDVYYDRQAKKLVMDTTHSGYAGWMLKEQAPLALQDGETLKLDLFLDRSVVEVYANEKQAICRRIYPEDPEQATGMWLLGNADALISLDVWDVFPSNAY